MSKPVIRLGISACLLGERVRYDGGHKLDSFLVNILGQYVEWVPVCSEVEIGLPVLREPVPEWVWQQAYLSPYPKELMLRNHV